MTQMTDENPIEHDETLEEDQRADAGEGAQETPEEAAAREEAEAEAKKYGWRPKEDFDKAPEGWVDAARFLEFPSTQVKVLRDTKRDLERRLEQERRERQEHFSRFEASQEKVRERIRQQEQAKYQAEIEAIRRQKREAASQADLQRYEELDRREAQLRPPEPDMPQQQAPGPAPEVEDYRRANEWAQNPALWAEAANAVNYMPGLQSATPKQQLEYAETVMRQKYPHLFQKEQPRHVSRVDSGGMATGRPRGKGAADLPADVAKVAKDYVSEGIYKSVDDYAKDYWAEIGQ